MEATRPVTLIIDGAPLRFASVDEAMKQVMVEHGRWVATRAANLAQRIRCGMWLSAVRAVAGHGDFGAMLERHGVPKRQAQRAMRAYRDDEDKKVGRGFDKTMAIGAPALKSDSLSHSSKNPHLELLPIIRVGVLRDLIEALSGYAGDASPMGMSGIRSTASRALVMTHDRALGALVKVQEGDPANRAPEITQKQMEYFLGQVQSKAPAGGLPRWVAHAMTWLQTPRTYKKGTTYEATASLGPSSKPGIIDDGYSPVDDDSDLGIDDDDWDRVPRADHAGSAEISGLGHGDGAGAGAVHHGGAKGAESNKLNTSPPVSLPGGVGLSQPPGGGKKKQKAVQLTFNALYESRVRALVARLTSSIADVKSMEVGEHEASEMLEQLEVMVEKLVAMAGGGS